LQRAKAEQASRRVTVTDPDEAEVEQPPEPTQRKQLRSVVIID
jgi:hypothetical protein